MNNSAMPIYYMRHERNSGAAAQRLRENEEHGRQSPRRDSSPRRRISEKTIGNRPYRMLSNCCLFATIATMVDQYYYKSSMQVYY